MSESKSFNLANLFTKAVVTARPEAKIKEVLDAIENKMEAFNPNHDGWDHISKILDRLAKRGDEFSPSDRKRLMELVTRMHDGMVHHAPIRHIFRVIASWKEAIEPMKTGGSFFDFMLSKDNVKSRVKIKTTFLIALIDVAGEELKENWKKYLVQFVTDLIDDPIASNNINPKLKGFLAVLANGVVPDDEEFVVSPAPKPDLEPKEGDDKQDKKNNPSNKKGNAYRNGKNNRRGGIPEQKYSSDTTEGNSDEGQQEVIPATPSASKPVVKIEETPAGDVLRQFKGGLVEQTAQATSPAIPEKKELLTNCGQFPIPGYQSVEELDQKVQQILGIGGDEWKNHPFLGEEEMGLIGEKDAEVYVAIVRRIELGKPVNEKMKAKMFEIEAMARPSREQQDDDLLDALGLLD